MGRSSAVLLTLLVYNAALILIGFLARRRTHDGLDYFLGGRQLGPFVASISASASSSSAWTLLGVSGAAYGWGLSALWLFPSCVGGFVLNWYVVAPALRRHSRKMDAMTVTDVLAGPAGQSLRSTISTIASAIVLVSLGAYVASQFLSAGKTFSETFQVSLTTSILVGGGVIVFYTLLGGFWAVSLTDAVQGIVMAGTAILLPVAALIRVGGLDGFWQGLAAVPQEGFISLTSNLPGIAALGLILGYLGIGLGYPGQPHVVNRFMALKGGSRELRIARWCAIGWAVAVYSGMLVLGLCGRILFSSLEDQELVFVVATNELFPAVVSGVMVAAVLSAVMSTADSQLLVAASAVTHDLKLGGGRDKFLARSRWVVLGLSAGALVAALTGSQEIFSSVLFAWTAMGAAFGPSLVLIALGKRVAPRRVLVAMVLGFGIAVAAYSFPQTQGGPVERVLPFVVGLIVLLAPGATRDKS